MQECCAGDTLTNRFNVRIVNAYFTSVQQNFADSRELFGSSLQAWLEKCSTCVRRETRLGMRQHKRLRKNAVENGKRRDAYHMEKGTKCFSRRALLGAFAATAVTAAPTFSNAAGFLRGAGDIRRLNMYSSRTGEKVETIYWIEGEYIQEALKEIAYFMRDWRNDETKTIDRRSIDIMSAAHNLLDATEPYTLFSGYRSPATNAMLRSRSRGVAKNSLHMQGQAADLHMLTRSVSQLASAAEACRAGGVGRYTGSKFVHVDCGVVRTWGR